MHVLTEYGWRATCLCYMLRAKAGDAEAWAIAQWWSGLAQCVPLRCTATAVQD